MELRWAGACSALLPMFPFVPAPHTSSRTRGGQTLADPSALFPRHDSFLFSRGGILIATCLRRRTQRETRGSGG